MSIATNTLTTLLLTAIGSLLTATAAPFYGPTDHFDMHRGMSDNTVVGLTEDASGHIWMATENGLNRFDGNTFTIYSRHDGAPATLSADELNCVQYDAVDDAIWIGTQREGLDRYDCRTDTLTYFLHDPHDANSLCFSGVTDIVAGAHGHLWFSTWGGGVDLYDRSSQTFRHYDTNTIRNLASYQTWTCCEDASGHLYVGHVKQGFSVVDLATGHATTYGVHTHPDSLHSRNVHSLLADSRGRIWVGTDAGLQRFETSRGRFVEYSTLTPSLAGRIYDIVELASGDICVATSHSQVVILHPDDSYDTLRLSPLSTYPQHVIVRSLLQDTYGNLWVGTERHGCYFFSCQPTLFHTDGFSVLPSVNNLYADRAVTSMAMAPDGRHYALGTDGDGVIIVSGDTLQEVLNPGNGRLPYGHITALQYDEAGTLWIGASPGGLYRYAAGSRGRKGRPAAPQLLRYYDEVHCIAIDDQQRLWTGTYGIDCYDITSGKFVSNITGPNNFVWSICIDSLQRIWAGTFGGGLIVYDTNGHVICHHSSSNSFRSNNVFDLLLAHDGTLWAATGDGLAAFADADPLHCTLYGTSHGLADVCIHALAEDDDGNLWLTTSGGISQRQMLAGTFVNYDGYQQLAHVSFCNASRMRDCHGNIYFGTTEGVCSFSATMLSQPHASPLPRINAICSEQPMGSPAATQEAPLFIHPQRPVTLGTRFSTFLVRFSAANHADEGETLFAYRLHGHDETWYDAGDAREVLFHKVPKGNYQFQLRCRRYDGTWSDDMATAALTVQAAWWQTAAARVTGLLLAALLAALLLTLLIHQLRLRAEIDKERSQRLAEEEFNRQRAQYFTSMAHELRTPLTLIVAPLDRLKHSPTLSPADRQQVELMQKSTDRLETLIGNLMELRKIETGNWHLSPALEDMTQLVESIGQRFSQLARQRGVALYLDLPSVPFPFGTDREAVTQIIDNLLSNAFKYTMQGAVTLSLRRVDAPEGLQAEIAVTDTGYGITPQAQQHVFDSYWQENGPHQQSGTGIGLALVHKLAMLHAGTATVSSTPGSGSTFRVLLTNLIAMDDTPAPAAGDLDDAHTPTMLVVEDDDDIRTYISQIFSHEYRVLEAVDGRAGVALAREQMPDIVVSDIMMPMANGLELCQQLRQDIVTSHIPIILLTAKDGMEDRQAGYDAGADSYLTKPFTEPLIRSRVANLMQQRQTLRNLFVGSLLPTAADSDEAHARQHREAMGRLDNEFIDKLTALITARMNDNTFDIDHMASAMNMSRSSFYRKITALTDMSPKDFQTKIKMREAERLIIGGEKSLSEICFDVGYTNMVSFRKAFREEYGLLPSDYVRKLKENSL